MKIEAYMKNGNKIPTIGEYAIAIKKTLQLNGMQKAILRAYLSFANGKTNDNIYPTYPQVAVASGFSKRAVAKWTPTLISLGWLEVMEIFDSKTKRLALRIPSHRDSEIWDERGGHDEQGASPSENEQFSESDGLTCITNMHDVHHVMNDVHHHDARGASKENNQENKEVTNKENNRKAFSQKADVGLDPLANGAATPGEGGASLDVVDTEPPEIINKIPTNGVGLVAQLQELSMWKGSL